MAIPKVHDRLRNISKAIPKVHDRLCNVSKAIPEVHDRLCNVSKAIPKVHDRLRNVSKAIPKVHDRLCNVSRAILKVHDRLRNVSKGIGDLYQKVFVPVEATAPIPHEERTDMDWFEKKPAKAIRKTSSPFQVQGIHLPINYLQKSIICPVRFIVSNKIALLQPQKK